MTSRVLVSSSVSEPDIVAGPSQMEGQWVLLVHDEGIGRFKQAMLQENNRCVSLYVRGLHSEHSLIVTELVLMSVALIVVALLNNKVTKWFVEIWVLLCNIVAITTFYIIPDGWWDIPIAFVLFLFFREFVVQITMKAHKHVHDSTLLWDRARKVRRLAVSLVGIAVVKAIEWNLRLW